LSAVQDKTKPRKPLSRRALGWLIEIALLILVVYLLHLWQTRDTVKGVAPPLIGNTLSDAPFDLQDQRGKPMVVHFWATWCPVCQLEVDSIDALAQDHQLISVAMQSGSEAEIQAYLQENDLSFPVISDPEGRLSASWGVRGVPTTFILDDEGKIQFTEVGYTTSLGLRARIWWIE
jgi:thiol-disulfide isomerase/thioredoxin